MCFKRIKEIINPLKPAGTIDIHMASSILLDKLEEIGDDKAEIYLPDTNFKIYRKDDVAKFLSLDKVDEIIYVAEEQDCDDSAAEMFGKGLSLIWTYYHAFNWFIDTDNILWFVEPQNDKISQELSCSDVRFYLGR